MTLGAVLLLVDSGATVFMAGVIWTMQILNYPLLAVVGREALPGYEAAHNRRFGVLVIPGVLLSLVAAIGLMIARPATVPIWGPIGELVLILAIIISTAVLQAPQHGRLARGFDGQALALLVRSNWIRVAAWTAAGLLALWMCGRAING